MPSNVLFIVEGGEREGKYLDECFKKLGLLGTFNVFRYGCNLYSFFNCLHKAQPDDDFSDIDVLGALRENARELPCKKDVELLSRAYTDLFLVFDVDNHDTNQTPKRRHEILQIMGKYFTSATDMGQLILDSPMIEAYCDVKVDKTTNEVKLNRDIAVSESVAYKQLVNDRGLLKIDISNFGRDTFLILAKLHYQRLSSLVLGSNGISLYPNYDLTPFIEALLEQIKNETIPIVSLITLLPMFLSSEIEKEILSIPLNTGMHFPQNKHRH